MEDFAQHGKLLRERVAKAREFSSDPATQGMLDEENKAVDQYLKAGDGLVAAIVHGSADAASQLGPYLQLYKDLQGKIETTSDQLEKSAKQTELDAESRANHATRAMFIMCGCSILLLLVVATKITLNITRGLDRLARQFGEMENTNDLTIRVDQDRKDEIGGLGVHLNLFVGKVHDILAQIAGSAEQVAHSSEEFSAASQHITTNSAETSAQANLVSNATLQVSENLQSVSKGATEMSTTIQSIATNAHEAAKVASNAVESAEETNAVVTKLGESSGEIGQVIKVITSIAQQTNLLALNAAIEAARAGEAGKGFAVVANEVKELAKQTAKATEDIGPKIAAIQADTKGAVEAIGTIGAIIHQVNDISATIAAAVEEKSATTTEMTRNVGEAARGAGEISNNISSVAQAANAMSSRAQESQNAAQHLAQISAQLHDLVAQFKLSSEKTAEFRVASSQKTGKAMAAHA